MASQVVSYELDDGAVVQFEIEPGEDWSPVGTEQVVAKVKEAVRPAVTAAKAVLDEVVHLAPGDVEVKFGVKVNGSANWLVAKASSEASFEVTLTWHPGIGRQDATQTQRVNTPDGGSGGLGAQQ